MPAKRRMLWITISACQGTTAFISAIYFSHLVYILAEVDS